MVKIKYSLSAKKEAKMPDDKPRYITDNELLDIVSANLKRKKRILAEHMPFQTLKRKFPNNTLVCSMKEIWDPKKEGEGKLYIYFESIQDKKDFFNHCAIQFRYLSDMKIKTTNSLDAKLLAPFPFQYNSVMSGMYFYIPQGDDIELIEIIFSNKKNELFVYNMKHPLDSIG